MKAALTLENISAEGEKLTLTLSTTDYMYKTRILDALESEKKYTVDFTQYRSKRSLEQNRLLWKLLDEIDHAVNGERSNDAMSFYIMALEKAGAKKDVVKCTQEAENDLKAAFRAVRPVMYFKDGTALYEIYWGSSKFNTKQMSKLIDCVLDMAQEAGIDTYAWRDALCMNK